MGQDNEASAELQATIQHDHVAMKSWYNTCNDAEVAQLRQRFGLTYPSMWREVVSWDGWRETRKCFLKSTEGGGAGNTNGSNTNGSVAAAGNTNGSNTNGEGGKERKRRRRWGTAEETPSATTNDPPRKRKSRWARGRDETPKPVNGSLPTGGGGGGGVAPTVLDILPGLPTNLNSIQSTELTSLQAKLRQANDRLDNLEEKAAAMDALPIGHPDRSPSPPPVYGIDGKRKNTRAVRWREKYTALRQDTLEQILSLTSGGAGGVGGAGGYNPLAVAPSLFKRKRTKKIPIPIEKHPTYNFIGLIIGPRGKTQKEMESKTGCKIAIRGKGSIKEGARGRRDGKALEGDDEALHVVITGDNQNSVDAAADMIDQMLVVIDDDKNVHKQQQLRELALLNGTLKDEEFCSLCAEKGHRAFECPKRFSMNSKTLAIKCAICGDTSHPTRDCRQKPAEDGKDEKQLDSDYLAFMNELDGKPPPPTAAAVDGTDSSARVVGITPPVTTCLPVTLADSAKLGGSVITTISSRIVKPGETNDDSTATPATSVTTNTSTDNATSSIPATMTTTALPPVATTISAVQTISNKIIPATTTISPIPPSATATTADASNTESTPAISLPPPPTMAVGGITSIPPPTTITGVPPPVVPLPAATPATTTPYVPPPPQQQSYYTAPPSQQTTTTPYTTTPNMYSNTGYPPAPPPPQQSTYNYGNAAAGSTQGNHNSIYGQQQQQQQQPPQPPTNQNTQQQQQASGWDYRSYYGPGQTGGDASGAGGFNWWES